MNNNTCILKLKKPITINFILLEHTKELKPYKTLLKEEIYCINFINNNYGRIQIDFLSKDKILLSLFLYEKFTLFNSKKHCYEIKDMCKYSVTNSTTKPTIIYKEIKKIIENLKDDEIIRISQCTTRDLRMSDISISHGNINANSFVIDYNLLGYSSFDNNTKRKISVPWYRGALTPIWLLFINNKTGNYQEGLLKVLSYYVIEKDNNNTYDLHFILDTDYMRATDFKLNITPVVKVLKRNLEDLRSSINIYACLDTCLDILRHKQAQGLVIELGNQQVNLGIVSIKGNKVVRENMTLDYFYSFQLCDNFLVIHNAKSYKLSKLLKTPK